MLFLFLLLTYLPVCLFIEFMHGTLVVYLLLACLFMWYLLVYVLFTCFFVTCLLDVGTERREKRTI